MKRKLRTPEDLEQIFAEYPSHKDLYEELSAIDNLSVEPSGKGEGVFKVYLSHRRGQYESFLWVNKSLDKSYVQWAHQGDHTEQCRDLWGPVVKNRSNPDGSELQRDVSTETIIRISRQYADIASS